MTKTKPATRQRDPQALRVLATRLLAYPQEPNTIDDAEVIFDLFAVPIGTAADGGPRGYIWPEDNPGWNLGIRFPGRNRAWFNQQRPHTDDNGHKYHPPVIERDGALIQMNDLRILPVTSSVDAAMKLLRVVPWLAPVLDYPNRTVRLLNGIGLPVGGKDYACEGEIPIALTAAILLAAADQAEQTQDGNAPSNDGVHDAPENPDNAENALRERAKTALASGSFQAKMAAGLRQRNKERERKLQREREKGHGRGI